jgi:hypothetical protein
MGRVSSALRPDPAPRTEIRLLSRFAVAVDGEEVPARAVDGRTKGSRRSLPDPHRPRPIYLPGDARCWVDPEGFLRQVTAGRREMAEGSVAEGSQERKQ